MIGPTDQVAFVVPCRNEARFIGGLLDALTAQTRPPDEVVIVDDGSTDGTAAVVEEWTREHLELVVRVVPGPARRPAGAMNAGIRATNAETIVRCDGHSLPAPDYVDQCVRTLVTAGNNAIVGGLWEVSPGADSTMAAAVAAVVSHPLGSGGAAYRQGGAGRDVETVPFGAYPRSLWEALKGYDETLAVNEDFDFNYRARRAGYRVVFDPAIRAAYFARPTLGALKRQYRRYGFWKRQMLRKDSRALHRRQIPAILLAPWLVLTVLAVLLVPGLAQAALALIYPLGVAAGGLWISVVRGVNPIAAILALATVHIAWSAGFWSRVRPYANMGSAFHDR